MALRFAVCQDDNRQIVIATFTAPKSAIRSTPNQTQKHFKHHRNPIQAGDLKQESKNALNGIGMARALTTFRAHNAAQTSQAQTTLQEKAMTTLTRISTVIAALVATTSLSHAQGFFSPANCPGGVCNTYGSYRVPASTTYASPYGSPYATSFTPTQPYAASFAPTQPYGAPGCVNGQCVSCPNGNCYTGATSYGAYGTVGNYGASCTCPTGNCAIHGQSIPYQGVPMYGAPVNSLPYGVQYRGSVSNPAPMQNTSPYSIGASNSPYYSGAPSTVDVRNNPLNLSIPARPESAPSMNRDRFNGSWVQPVSAPTYNTGNYHFN